MNNLKFLSRKELKVYNLMLTTLTYDQMAEKFNLSAGGLRFHVNIILSKMQFCSRISLICDHFEENKDFEFIEPDWLSELSPKESDNFYLLAAGYTVNDSAEILNLSVSGVGYLRRKLFIKAGVKNALNFILKFYVKKAVQSNGD